MTAVTDDTHDPINLISRLRHVSFVLFSIYRKICNNIEYHQIDSGGPDADCSRVGSVDEVTHFFLKRKKNSNNSVIIALLCPS